MKAGSGGRVVVENAVVAPGAGPPLVAVSREHSTVPLRRPMLYCLAREDESHVRRERDLNGDIRVGVFGGTFDPIHIGHLIVAEIMRFRLQLAQVIFLPAGVPPHKPGRIVSASEHRVAMLRISIGESSNFAISTIDLDREGWSYTADSLRILRNRISETSELYFLMGQDSLRDFPTWNRPNLIAAQARLGVALRPGVEVSVAEIEHTVPETRNRIDLVSIPLIGVSSTEIRANVRSGGPYRYQVLPGVADYIRDHGLYLDVDERN